VEVVLLLILRLELSLNNVHLCVRTEGRLSVRWTCLSPATTAEPTKTPFAL